MKKIKAWLELFLALYLKCICSLPVESVNGWNLIDGELSELPITTRNKRCMVEPNVTTRIQKNSPLLSTVSIMKLLSSRFSIKDSQALFHKYGILVPSTESFLTSVLLAKDLQSDQAYNEYFISALASSNASLHYQVLAQDLVCSASFNKALLQEILFISNLTDTTEIQAKLVSLLDSYGTHYIDSGQIGSLQVLSEGNVVLFELKNEIIGGTLVLLSDIFLTAVSPCSCSSIHTPICKKLCSMKRTFDSLVADKVAKKLNVLRNTRKCLVAGCLPGGICRMDGSCVIADSKLHMEFKACNCTIQAKVDQFSMMVGRVERDQVKFIQPHSLWKQSLTGMREFSKRCAAAGDRDVACLQFAMLEQKEEAMVSSQKIYGKRVYASADLKPKMYERIVESGFLYEKTTFIHRDLEIWFVNGERKRNICGENPKQNKCMQCSLGPAAHFYQGGGNFSIGVYKKDKFTKYWEKKNWGIRSSGWDNNSSTEGWVFEHLPGGYHYNFTSEEHACSSSLIMEFPQVPTAPVTPETALPSTSVEIISYSPADGHCATKFEWFPFKDLIESRAPRNVYTLGEECDSLKFQASYHGYLYISKTGSYDVFLRCDGVCKISIKEKRKEFVLANDATYNNVGDVYLEEGYHRVVIEHIKDGEYSLLGGFIQLKGSLIPEMLDLRGNQVVKSVIPSNSNEMDDIVHSLVIETLSRSPTAHKISNEDSAQMIFKRFFEWTGECIDRSMSFSALIDAIDMEEWNKLNHELDWEVIKQYLDSYFDVQDELQTRSSSSFVVELAFLNWKQQDKYRKFEVLSFATYKAHQQNKYTLIEAIKQMSTSYIYTSSPDSSKQSSTSLSPSIPSPSNSPSSPSSHSDNKQSSTSLSPSILSPSNSPGNPSNSPSNPSSPSKWYSPLLKPFEAGRLVVGLSLFRELSLISHLDKAELMESDLGEDISVYFLSEISELMKWRDFPKLNEFMVNNEIEQLSFAVKSFCTDEMMSWMSICWLPSLEEQLSIMLDYGQRNDRAIDISSLADTNVQVYLIQLEKLVKDYQNSLELQLLTGKVLHSQQEGTLEMISQVNNGFANLGKHLVETVDFETKQLEYVVELLVKQTTSDLALASAAAHKLGEMFGVLIAVAIGATSGDLIQSSVVLGLRITDLCNPLKWMFGSSGTATISIIDQVDKVLDKTSNLEEVVTIRRVFLDIASNMQNTSDRLDSLVSTITTIRLVLRGLLQDNLKVSDLKSNAASFLLEFRKFVMPMKISEIDFYRAKFSTLGRLVCQRISSSTGVGGKIGRSKGMEACMEIEALVAQVFSYYAAVFNRGFIILEKMSLYATRALTYQSAKMFTSTIRIKNSTSQRRMLSVKSALCLIMIQSQVQQTSLIVCDYFRYQQGGESYPLCESIFKSKQGFSDKDMSKLIAYTPNEAGTWKRKMVYIPTTPAFPGDLAYINLTKLSEETIIFQLPMNGTWLERHSWMSKLEFEHQAHFIKRFQLFLPVKKNNINININIQSRRYLRLHPTDPKSYTIPQQTYFTEYSHLKRCFGQVVGNMYNLCDDKDTLCVSSLGDVSAKQDAILPSVFAAWEISLINKLVLPKPATDLLLIANVHLLMHSPSLVSQVESMSSGQSCCQGSKKYSIPFQTAKCGTCPEGSVRASEGYFCESLQ